MSGKLPSRSRSEARSGSNRASPARASPPPTTTVAGAVREIDQASTSAIASTVSVQSAAARASPAFRAASTSFASAAPNRRASPPAEAISSTRRPRCGPATWRSCPTSPVHAVPSGIPSSSTHARARPVPTGANSRLPGRPRPAPASRSPAAPARTSCATTTGRPVRAATNGPMDTFRQPRFTDDRQTPAASSTMPGTASPTAVTSPAPRTSSATRSAVASPDGSFRGVGTVPAIPPEPSSRQVFTAVPPTSTPRTAMREASRTAGPGFRQSLCPMRTSMRARAATAYSPE